jgi:hypothetical protein
MDIEITPQNDDFMIIQSLVAPAAAVVQQPAAGANPPAAPAVAAVLPKYKLVINNIALQVKTVISLRLIRLIGNLD